jgi:hypothetical protein
VAEATAAKAERRVKDFIVNLIDQMGRDYWSSRIVVGKDDKSRISKAGSVVLCK